MDHETPKPTIDLQSPCLKRPDLYKKKIATYGGRDRARMYRTMKKFRTKQLMLLGDKSMEDPDPFDPTYVFYCFTGVRED